MMDADLQKLLIAWTTGFSDETIVSPLVERLKRDDAFRDAFVAEIILLGQLRAVQSSEPRWLQLEDALESKPNASMSIKDLENRVMESIASGKVSSSQSRNVKWASSSTLLTPQLVWPLTLAATLMGVLLWSGFGIKRDWAMPTHSPITENRDTRDYEVRNPDHSAEVRGVAILSQSIGVEWLSEKHPVVGETLEVGDLKIKSGTLQIEFFAGVRLLLRGPADFELRAPDEMRLRQGTASCFVSELGRGFRVLTEDMEVIDLGTAFSMDVQNGKQTEVHVLEGEVEIKSETVSSVTLKKNQAIRMAPSGPVDATFTPSRFPQPADLLIEHQNYERQRFQAWKNFSDTLNSDSAVMVHYTFEDLDYSPLELSNRASDSSHATDGVIIGCNWSEGRWASKRALQYRNPGDRVLFQVSGQHEQLTCMVWVRIDALTQTQTSLLMTEEPARRRILNPTASFSIADAMARRKSSHVKSVRWELFQPVPRVSFSVAYAEEENNWKWQTFPAESDFPNQANWGKWTCIAVTCDARNRKVIQYHNGERIGDWDLQHSDPLLLDFMTLGNFSVSDLELKTSGGLAQRRFFGAFDEVLIANRIFNDDEMLAIWTNGKP